MAEHRFIGVSGRKPTPTCLCGVEDCDAARLQARLAEVEAELSVANRLGNDRQVAITAALSERDAALEAQRKAELQVEELRAALRMFFGTTIDLTDMPQAMKERVMEAKMAAHLALASGPTALQGVLRQAQDALLWAGELGCCARYAGGEDHSPDCPVGPAIAALARYVEENDED